MKASARVEIQDGLGILDISEGIFESALLCNGKVAAVCWPDFQGSVAEYLKIAGIPEAQRREFLAEVRTTVEREVREYNLLELAWPFLRLFTNGTYRIACEELERGQDEIYYDDNIRSGMDGFYPLEGFNILSTQSRGVIRNDRVEFYKQSIADGAKPFVVIADQYCPELEQQSHAFLIDGHHKALAYTALQRNIPALILTRIAARDQLRCLPAQILEETLSPEQMKHLRKHRKIDR